MPRLLLMRHAKASWWEDGSAPDIERPLIARGRRAATLVGEHMAAHRLLPDAVVCSVAQRTRETLACLLPFLTAEAAITVTGAIYDAPVGAYRKAVMSAGDARTLLIVGHNPSIQELALSLIGGGNEELAETIGEKYPTAALAVIDFDKPWRDLAPGSGRIVSFFRPGSAAMVGEEATAEED